MAEEQKSKPVEETKGFIFDPTPRPHDVLGHIIVICYKCDEKLQDTSSAVHAAGWQLSRGKWTCGKCRGA